jgi:hypothetical protein
MRIAFLLIDLKKQFNKQKCSTWNIVKDKTNKLGFYNQNRYKTKKGEEDDKN